MLEVIPAGTPEWHKARVGKWTASRAPALMASTKAGDPKADCFDYIAEIAFERISGVPVDHYVNAAMRRGLELEPDMWTAYDFRRGVVSLPGGLVVHPDFPNVAGSPDRFVEPDGLVEGKAPQNVGKHLGVLISAIDTGGAMSDAANRLVEKAAIVEYEDQGQWQLWVTGHAWVDMTSYDPRIGVTHDTAIERLEADRHRHREFAERVAWAESQVGDIIRRAAAA